MRPEPSWTHRYLFPLTETLAAAEEASNTDDHHQLDPTDTGEPALWLGQPEGTRPYLVSNGARLHGLPRTTVQCQSGTYGGDPWLTGSASPTALRLYRPSDLPDGANLLDSLRRAARNGHTHLVVETGTTADKQPCFRLRTVAVPAPPAPAAPLWWTLHAMLREAGLEVSNYGDHGGNWAQVPLADGTRIGISATVLDGRDVQLCHPQAQFTSWQAYWYGSDLTDPDGETAELFDSSGSGEGYAADTAALVAAVTARAAEHHAATAPAYPLPEGPDIAAAVEQAVTTADAAMERLVRVVLVVLAAAVRDVLTRFDHGAPFDATGLELREGADGSLFPTGRYWTAAGHTRTLATHGESDTGNVTHDMSQWSARLGDHNYDLWHPLCEEVGDVDGRTAYRLDLPRAAQLSLTESGNSPAPAQVPES